MVEQWIDALTARDIVGNGKTICVRAHAGLIKAKASLFVRDDKGQRNTKIPPEFWEAGETDEFVQNWHSGDFSAWINHNAHWQVFGATFALSGLLDCQPFEQRATTARRLSVAGQSQWLSAVAARKFMYERAGVSVGSAGEALIEQCRLGFVSARAVLMQQAPERSPSTWENEAREWDVPATYWSRFVIDGHSSQSWDLGRFAAREVAYDGYCWTILSDVRFLRGSLDSLITAATDVEGAQTDLAPTKPPVPEAELKRWWQRRSSVREKLSQSDLWVLAKADFPAQSIARDRIRALADGRTPGPKTN